MKDIIMSIKNKPLFVGLEGASVETVSKAERSLGVCFAKDYREYVCNMGVASFQGHELTGLCKSARLDVVTVTMYERNINPTIPKDWYVIEQTNIDGIVIWQNELGEIYQTIPGLKPTKICDSLIDYVNL